MKQVFMVDDNFIGNHARALELCVELEKWQQAHGFPVMFYTEASMDLARKTALMDAMVKANFFYVFLGIESPSKESLQETKKFQNLAMDPVSCVDLIHEKGLWVTGGFIVGFDSDTEDIFDRQIEFIERTAIPWAMLNSLHAMPRTALYDRMQKEGRLLAESPHAAATPILPTFAPNWRRRFCCAGRQKRSRPFTNPKAFYERAWRSMESWKIKKNQRAARQPGAVGIAAIVARSIWQQGIQIVLPKRLLEIPVPDSHPLRLESPQNLDGRHHHDLRPPLHSLFPRSRGGNRAPNCARRSRAGT